MNHPRSASLPSRLLVALISTALAMPAAVPAVYAQDSNQAPAQNASQAPAQKMSQAQLAALVAPIALYPDPLVAQVLMASTYPLEVAEAYNWQRDNSRLQGSALNQALQQQNWDPSVKSLVSFPPVLGMMGSELNWTQQLGDAVLAQQSDVMDSIQELRAKAKAAGALQSNAQQTVTTQGSGSNETIVIQPANPQVVYVPTYNPSVVYGGWPYPAYPPYAYYPPGYVAGTALLSFGIGMAVGAALWGGCHWGGGGWGWGGGRWGGGGNSLTINNNNFNNFNRTTNNNWSGGNRSGTSNWSGGNRTGGGRTGGGGGNIGGGERSGGGFGGGGSGGGSRDAQRDQLRQSLDHGGLSGGGGRTSGGERSGGFGGGGRTGGSHDPGGFGGGGSHFGGGDHFGGSGGSHFGGGSRSGGGGSHFGGGGGSHFGGGGGSHFGGGGGRR